MKISVIVPVYNAAATFRRCAASILSQTYTDFELILVDDGSTDGSVTLCDELAKKDPRVRVIHQPNAGQSAARNHGIRQARGHYVYFADADDHLLDDHCLQDLAALAHKHGNPDLVVADADAFIGLSGKLADLTLRQVPLPEFTTDRRLIKQEMLHNYCFEVVWNRLIKRSLFLDNPELYFREGICREDLLWDYLACKHISSLALLRRVTYAYYSNPAGVTRSAAWQQHQQRSLRTVILLMVEHLDDFCRRDQVSLIREKYQDYLNYRERLPQVELLLGTESHDLWAERLLARLACKPGKFMFLLSRGLMKLQRALLGSLRGNGITVPPPHTTPAVGI